MSLIFLAVTGAACGLVLSRCIKTWAQSNLLPAFLYPLLPTIILYFFCSWNIADINCVLFYWMYHSSECHFPTLVIQISHSWPTCSQNDHIQGWKNSNLRFLEHTVVPCNSEVHCGSSIFFGTYIFANLLVLIISVTGVKCPFFASVFFFKYTSTETIKLIIESWSYECVFP